MGKNSERLNLKVSFEEKVDRVIALLEAIENLSLIVKGNLDNAEPIFVIGGFSNKKTHVFENVVRAKNGKFIISEDLLEKKNQGYNVGLLKGENFINENEVVEKLNPVSVSKFFEELKGKVKEYYGVE